MAELSRDALHRLARLGAERRLEELKQEEAVIRAAFPNLGTAGGAGRRLRGRPAGGPLPAAKGAAARRRRRRPPMTAAQKRAVSERMKKYWADRRKARG